MENAAWGAANSSVTSKPTNYEGANQIWGPPAPTGPYGNPGPGGGGDATLASTFNGLTPNGTWSLYVITTAAGDGTGAIAGGWCLGVTVPSRTSTETSTSLSGGGRSGAEITVPGGTPVTDSGTLAGSNASDATGEVEYKVFDGISGNGTCSGLLTSVKGTASVAGEALPASEPITLSTPGVYYWVAAYGGDAANEPSESECGSEVERVAGSPTATISAPLSGGSYQQGSSVPTAFSCIDGEDGPGIESCTDSNGGSGTSGALDTSAPGPHVYTVTAKSVDGQTEVASISYSVEATAPTCSTAVGSGSYLKSGQVGRLTVLDSLSTSLEGTQKLRVRLETGVTRFRLKRLESASCVSTPGGGLRFSGSGQAAFKNSLGYTITFSIEVKQGHTYFSAVLVKGKEVIHEAVGEPLMKSNEKIK